MTSEKGHGQCADDLIEAETDVNKQSKGYTSGGCRALMRAVEEGNKKYVKSLLKSATDVNQHDESGQTALIRAVKADRLSCVDLLIQVGADVNSIHIDNALTSAVKKWSREICRGFN